MAERDVRRTNLLLMLRGCRRRRPGDGRHWGRSMALGEELDVRLALLQVLILILLQRRRHDKPLGEMAWK